MEIVTKEIDTRKYTTDYIIAELIKVFEKKSLTTQANKINLSLDLTKPEYILADAFCNDGEIYFRCEYFRGQKKIYTGDIYKKQMEKDIGIMLDAVSYMVQREAFEQKCYKLYQLEWMMSHGFSIDDITSFIKASIVDQVKESGEGIANPVSAGNFAQCAIEELYNEGFDGQLFVCIDEFLDNEYKDPSYMQWLFNSQVDVIASEMKSEYEKYTGTCIDDLCDLKVHTSAGVLRAYKNNTPVNPGISVLFQPAGFEDEIDLMEACVYEDPDAARDGERPVDVVVKTFTDPKSEEFTTRNIIMREAILSALSPLETIYTHNMSADIIECFEEYLDDCGVAIPSPDDDEREEDNTAVLYGEVYSNLLDEVESLIIELLEGKSSMDEARRSIYNEFIGVVVKRKDPHLTPGLELIDPMIDVHFTKKRGVIDKILIDAKTLKDNGAEVISYRFS